MVARVAAELEAIQLAESAAIQPAGLAARRFRAGQALEGLQVVADARGPLPIPHKPADGQTAVKVELVPALQLLQEAAAQEIPAVLALPVAAAPAQEQTAPEAC
jgi:hypothetical protein